MPLKSFTHRELSNLVNRRHNEYNAMLPHWKFLKQTYTGGPQYFTEENIFKHTKEGSDYEDRLRRAYRFNHSREVVDLINKYVFRGQIDRSGDAPEYLKTFWKEATWQRRSIEQFSFHVSTESSIFGQPWIIVDSNLTDDDDIRSVRDAEENEFRVYAYVVSPEQVTDLSYDEDGDLNWICIKEVDRDDEDPWEDLGGTREQYRLWTKNEWYLVKDNLLQPSLNPGLSQELIAQNHAQYKDGSNERYQLIGYGEHNLGEVPAIPANHMEANEGQIPAGLISDIAYLDRACTNYLSNLDEIIQYQTFSQLAIPMQAMMAHGITECEDGSVTRSKTYDQMIEMGTKKIFVFDGEGGMKPEYLTPDPRQAGLIVDVIGKIINEIYSTVGLSAERTQTDNAVGVDHTSGVSKAFDMDRVNSLLINKGRALERIENRIAHFVALYNGEDGLERDYVTYSDDYDVRGLSDDLALAKNFTEIAAPPELRKYQMRNLIEKMFPQIEDEVKKKLMEDVSKWEPLSPLSVPEPSETEKAMPGKKSSTGGPSKQGQVTKK